MSLLTDSTDGRKYWNKLKQRLREEGSELVTICHQLKLKSSTGRLLAGVHWFTDIIGGILIGGALLMTFYSIIHVIKKEE